MLGPNFAEGQAQRSSTSPKSISLVDDNATTMTLMCNILHLQNASLPAQLSAADLRYFAIMADKYDCATAIKSICYAWFSQLDNFAPCESQLEVIEAAGLLDEATFFARFTDSLAKDNETSRLYCRTDDLNNTMLRVVSKSAKLNSTSLYMLMRSAAELQHSMNHARLIMSFIIERVVQTMSAKLIKYDEHIGHHVYINGFTGLNGHSMCRFASMVSAQYMWALYENGVWPSAEPASQSLQYRISALMDFRAPKISRTLACSYESCPSIVNDFKDAIENAKVEASELFAGLCLDCFKSGGDYQGQCRFKHEKNPDQAYEYQESEEEHGKEL